MQRRSAVVAAFVWLVAARLPLSAADKGNIGTVFVRVASSGNEGQKFADPALEATVKDIKGEIRYSKFSPAEDEAKADFLIEVVERSDTMHASFGNAAQVKLIRATLSFRDGDGWKPAIKLENSSGTTWRISAERILHIAEKWVQERGGK
jgi:hypothetical protein